MDELRRQIDSLHNKLDRLLQNGHFGPPRRKFSVVVLIITIIIGILGGVLAEYLMVTLGMKDGRRPRIILIFTIVSVFLLFLLRRLV